MRLNIGGALYLLAMAPVAMAIARPALAQDTASMLTASRQVAAKLIQEVGAQLREELAKGGADEAVAVCRTVAPEIAGRMSRQTGWRVSRVSLKTRNPALGTPDEWEQRVLADFDRRAAAGEKPETLEFSEIVSEPAGRFFRYIKAIPVQALCLICHGSTEAIPEAVHKRLWLEYPHDRATGYTVGQIRGGVTIKQPL
ncbi:MAG TPA: DUF3365 domain-containing protein [Burkholderiales bacterium]|nr:DUF3365 domain-containing protein [Burkholderiales bacterium]